MEASFCGSDFGVLQNYHFNIDHFQEAGRSLCETLLDYCLPNSTQRESFFRTKSNISHDDSFGIGGELSPVISVPSPQVQGGGVYGDTGAYVSAASPIPMTSGSEVVQVPADELSDVDDLASDESDVIEATKKINDCSNSFSQVGAKICLNSASGHSWHGHVGEYLNRTATDAEVPDNSLPPPSTTPIPKSNRNRRNRASLIVSEARPPMRLPLPSANRTRHGGRSK